MFRRARNPQVLDYIVEHVKAAGFRGEVLQNAEFSFWHWKLMSKDRGFMLCTRRQLHAPMPGTVCLALPMAISYGIDFLWCEGTDPGVVRAFADVFDACDELHRPAPDMTVRSAA